MAAPGMLVIRLSVPSQGGLRQVASDLAVHVAEHLGDKAQDSASVSAALETVATRVAPAGSEGDIEFEFSQSDGELLIEARCGSRRSEVRCPLPA